MLDVSLAGAAKGGGGVWAVDGAAEGHHDLSFYGLRIGIVIRVVGRTAMLRGDRDAAIGLGRGRAASLASE